MEMLQRNQSAASENYKELAPVVRMESCRVRPSAETRCRDVELGLQARKNNQGFTLLDMMIAVAILVILVAIALPSLQGSIMRANEVGAIGAMRTITTGQAGFQASALLDTNGDGIGEFATLEQLGDPAGSSGAPGRSGGRGGSRGKSSGRGPGPAASDAAVSFIDSVLASGLKHGYVFTVEPSVGPWGTPQYTAHADPQTPGKTGVRTFFIDETGVIRFNGDGNRADANSVPLN